MGIAGVGLMLELAGVPNAYGRSGAVLTAFAIYCTSVSRYADAIAKHGNTADLFGTLGGRINRIDADVRVLMTVSIHNPLGETDKAKRELQERHRLLDERRTLQELADGSRKTAARWSSTTRRLLELEGALAIAGSFLWGFGDLDLPAAWRTALLGRPLG